MTSAPATRCLSDDELLELAGGRALATAPEAEAHLATCATCSALLAAAVRDAAPRWDALAGTTLGPYRLDAQIGAGGMGAVYRAWDTRLDRALAVKVLPPDASVDEARAAATVDHPTVVAIHDVGRDGALSYIAMELVDGESLRSVIRRGPLAVERVRALGRQLADGLAAAHARGVIHRDLKPENLIVATDGRLRILDFGLARRLDAGTVEVTEAGVVHGTAGYMAPEQARGESVDARADLFAVGAILFELATGRRAFPGATPADRLAAVLRDEPRDAALGRLGPIVARCLARNPGERFHAAADLRWALDQLDAAAPATAAPPPPSRRLMLAATAAAAATGAAGFLLGRRGRRAVVPAGPGFRQLTFRTGRVSTARFTHDGAHVAFGAAWEGGAVRAFTIDLASGAATALPVPAGDVLAISRHGELALGLDRRFTDFQAATGRLATLPLAGGTPRPIAAGVQDADFAPDGTLVQVQAAADGFRLLHGDTALVAAQPWIQQPRVSPDGRRVAYLQHPETNDDAGDVVVIELASGTRRTVSAGWRSVAGLAWLDARTLWFSASAQGMRIAVRSLELDGATWVVAEAPGRLRLHDVLPDRRAAVSVDAWTLRTRVGDDGGDEHDRSRSDVSLVTDISRDGRTLAVVELGEVESSSGAYLMPSDGGGGLRLGPGWPLAISPSGQQVLAAVIDAGDVALVAYSTASAARRRLAIPEMLLGARWIDEESVVASGVTRLWRLSPTSDPQPLTAPGDTGRIAIDPGGRRCAWVGPDRRIRVVDLASPTTTVLPGEHEHALVCGWLADPDAVVLRSTTTPIALTRIDPVTGAATPYRTVAPPPLGLRGVDSFVLTADGSRHAYSYGHELSQLYSMTWGTRRGG